MRTFYTSGQLSVARVLGTMETWVSPAAVDAENKKSIGKKLSAYEDVLTEIGLSGALVTLERMVTLFNSDNGTQAKVGKLAGEFNGRLVDESCDKVFFLMTLGESSWYNVPVRGWERSLERFPSIRDDVEEASKCFALSRYPAAVFHSVQAVEAGLIELGKFLKISDPKSGWTAVKSALSKTVRKERQNMTAFEKKNFAFLEQVHGTVAALKDAWRNKISHMEGRPIVMSAEFSAEIAEEIIVASRAFMRKLADGLPPPKKKKGEVANALWIAEAKKALGGNLTFSADPRRSTWCFQSRRRLGLNCPSATAHRLARWCG